MKLYQTQFLLVPPNDHKTNKVTDQDFHSSLNYPAGINPAEIERVGSFWWMYIVTYNTVWFIWYMYVRLCNDTHSLVVSHYKEPRYTSIRELYIRLFHLVVAWHTLVDHIKVQLLTCIIKWKCCTLKGCQPITWVWNHSKVGIILYVEHLK